MARSITEDLLFLVRTHRAGAVWHCGPAAYRTIIALRDWSNAPLAQLAGPGLIPTFYGLPIVVDPLLSANAVELHDADGRALARIAEIGISVPCAAALAPLTYDAAIYWTEPRYHCEYRIDWQVFQDTRFDVREHARRNLRQLAAIESKKADWIAYTTVEDVFSEGNTLVIRHSLYEQPGFTKIHRYAGPPHIHQFRIQPQGGPIVTLDLRRLLCHGERARGALHGTELYVIPPAIAPEQQGGLRE